jgi:hypothetical protein
MIPPKPRTNITDICRFLDLVMVEDGITEVRAPDVPYRGTVTGYFDYEHKEEAAKAVASLSGLAVGVYCTLNPVNKTLLARAANRLRDRTPRGESVKDSDIIRLRFIPIDFDWERPEGISTTNAEHEATLKRTYDFEDALRAQGIQPVLLGDSGNGGHCLIAVDLSNTDESCRLIKRFFEGLASKFSDAPGPNGHVKFDTQNCNASRIWKVYGTIAAKGDHTPERPHRTAAILALRSEA